VPGIFEGAKKAKEKAAAKTNELKVQVGEHAAEMKEAGFAEARAKRLVPGESFFAFVGLT
jgi:hypothetical protein